MFGKKMCRFQVVIVFLFALLCNNVECANVTSFQAFVNSTTNVGDVPQVNSGWGRKFFSSWFVPRITSMDYGEGSKNYATNLARQLRFMPMNAVLSSFIYSLSVVPLFLALTSVFTPPPHGFYGRRKRALVNESYQYRHLPLLNREETRRFLSLFETTLLNRKIYSENCKKYYSCKVFHNAVRSDSFPTFANFELALLNVFGIVAERYDYKFDLIPTVKMYYEIATNAFKGISCSHMYPCSNDNNVSGKRRQGMAHSLRLSTSESNGTKTTLIASVRRRNQSSGQARR